MTLNFNSYKSYFESKYFLVDVFNKDEFVIKYYIVISINHLKTQQSLSEKLTFDKLKTYYWNASNILRGGLDANEYRQPIMTLLFLKRLNDQFEEKAEQLEKSGKSKKIAWEDSDYHAFFVPKASRWKEISQTFENIGEKIDKASTALERANSANYVNFEGILTNISYNDKNKYPDEDLLALVNHFNKYRLRNSDIENEDIFGQAYEYLLEQFADSAGKKAGEFFTPREVVKLLVEILAPAENMTICDPTCGSGGMLIWSRQYVQEHEGNPKNISLYGQERNYGNYGMCKINMILHGIENFKIVHGNTLTTPLLVEGGKLMTFDRVVANFPFSMNWDNSLAAKDEYGRFSFGIPPKKNKADFAFIQHMYSSLNEKGKAAIVCSQGILFRGNVEGKIRKNFVEKDTIEAVVALPSNLFFGTGIPACILILNNAKPKKRKNKILFIYAANDYLDLKKRDILRDQDIKKIISAYEKFDDIDRYCHIADKEEIIENEYNLNIPRYVDISKPEEEIDIQTAYDELKKINSEQERLKKLVEVNLQELDIKL